MIKRTTKLSFFFLSILLVATACTKEDEETENSLEDGKSTVIYDLAGDTGAAMGEGTDGKEQRPFYTFLFRFKDKKQIWIKTKEDSVQWLKSKDWDLAFTGPYNSEVFVNNAHKNLNPGYGGEADNTAVVMVEQAYDFVNETVSEEAFNNSEVNKIGWAGSSESPGWFYYSMSTHIMQAIPNRTYIIRLQDGKYAKLQLVNAYKGNPPAVTDLHWPAPYYTFRYFIQEDGTTNLKTR